MNNINILKSEINVGLIKLKGKYFVYHLIKDNEVIYVGYSKNIYKRSKEHKYQKDFDILLLKPVDSLLKARILERADIFTLKPSGNKSGKNNFEFPSDKKTRNKSMKFIIANGALLNRNKDVN
jgi:hypothetical protein